MLFSSERVLLQIKQKEYKTPYMVSQVNAKCGSGLTGHFASTPSVFQHYWPQAKVKTPSLDNRRDKIFSIAFSTN